MLKPGSMYKCHTFKCVRVLYIQYVYENTRVCVCVCVCVC